MALNGSGKDSLLEPGKAVRAESQENSDLWQEATDRVLLYLKMLGMEAIESLELAVEALRRAKAVVPGPDPAPVRPLALAMGALHDLLRDNPDLLAKTPYAEYPVLYRRWHREKQETSGSCAAGIPGPGGAPLMPPISRRSMKIKKL